MAYNDNLPTKQGTWEDSNIIINIAPTSIVNIYDTSISYDRSKRVIITGKNLEVKVKYGLYDVMSISEDFYGREVIVPISEDNNTITVVYDTIIYNMIYDVKSINTKQYAVSNGIQFNHTIKENKDTAIPMQFNFSIDDNKFVIRDNK